MSKEYVDLGLSVKWATMNIGADRITDHGDYFAWGEKPSDIPNVHTPDIRMDDIEWEIKCPEGSCKRTIEKNIVKAELQSHIIIFKNAFTVFKTFSTPFAPFNSMVMKPNVLNIISSFY